MKCSGFFILIVTVFLVFAAVVARAGQINQVNLVEGDVYTLEIGATACSGLKTLATTVDDTFLVQLVGPDCDNETAFSTILELPPCEKYHAVKVDLYRGDMLDDSRSMDVVTEIKKDACFQECAENHEACMAQCSPGDDACMAECDSQYSECIDVLEKVEFSMSCHPGTINLKSHGNWITCIIGNMGSNSTEMIDVTSLLLGVGDGTVPVGAVHHEDEDVLMVKFSRPEIINLIASIDDNATFPMAVDLTLTGNLLDGTEIQAVDSVMAINPGNQDKHHHGKHDHKHTGTHHKPGKHVSHRDNHNKNGHGHKGRKHGED
jgi:hypothetical protein